MGIRAKLFIIILLPNFLLLISSNYVIKNILFLTFSTLIVFFIAFIEVLLIDKILLKGIFELKNNLKNLNVEEISDKRLPINSFDEMSEIVKHINTMMDGFCIAKEDTEKAKLAAEEANRQKGEFLANMSHEIRTPLNAIIGMAELLGENSLTKKQKSMLNTISESGVMLLAIINDILDFSKIEAGKMNLNYFEYSVSDIVEGVSDIIAFRARTKNITLMTYVTPSIPRVKGDGERLKQILLNLAGNAIKFTEAGEITIRVWIHNREENYINLLFEVVDTGIGISSEAGKNLFKPFVQADGSTTRKYGGSGLGLSISKHFVELMGGEIGLKSELGKGSNFWFSLRLETSKEKISIPKLIHKEGHQFYTFIFSNTGTGKNIIQNYLSIWGIYTEKTEIMQSVPKSIKAGTKNNNRFDLLVFDLKNEEECFDSLKIIQNIKAENESNHVKIVVISTIDREEIKGEFTKLGINAFIQRPIKQSILFDYINDVMSNDIKSVAFDENAHTQDDEKMVFSIKTQYPILLVEDNAINRELAMMQLKKLGYEVIAVNNGKEAISAIKSNDSFVLALMDCQMPEMDGFEATRHIRRYEISTGKHMPIIAMTANAMQGDREHCIESGMDDYISKPIKIENLRAAINKWIN